MLYMHVHWSIFITSFSALNCVGPTMHEYLPFIMHEQLPFQNIFGINLLDDLHMRKRALQTHDDRDARAAIIALMTHSLTS